MTDECPYPLVCATITGSHAFGCADALSDYDVHGIHLLPLHNVLGFEPLRETIERKTTHPKDGLEVDIATHDLKKFVLLLLKGNGNILEDLYSPLVLHSTPLHEELKLLGKGCITKMLAHHYKGMAYNQQRRMKSNEVKKYLHTYRCLLMGIHLMRTGTLMMDLPTLATEYGCKEVRTLIAYKQAGFDFLPEEDTTPHTSVLEDVRRAFPYALDRG